MRKTIKILLFISFVFIVNCGYTPLFDSNKIDFYFSEVNFVGDKQINNYLNSVLKQHQNYSESKKKFTLNISSSYEKKIANKDDSGNPKNYTIIVKVEAKYISDDNKELTKTFQKNKSLASKNKKIEEREEEIKIKKDLSENISNDIFFYLLSN